MLDLRLDVCLVLVDVDDAVAVDQTVRIGGLVPFNFDGGGRYFQHSQIVRRRWNWNGDKCK